MAVGISDVERAASVVQGQAGLVNGPLEAEGALERGLERARTQGYKGA